MEATRRAVDRVLSTFLAPVCERRVAAKRLTVLAYHGVADIEAFDRQVEWLGRHRSLITADQGARIVQGKAPMPEGATLITFDDGQTSVHDLALPILERHGAPAVVFVVTDLIDTSIPFWWTEVEAATVGGARVSWLPALSGRALVRHLKDVPDERRRAAMDELRAASPSTKQAQLTTAQLRRLEAGGVAVGSHTRSHPCLDKCSAETLREEIVGAARDLERILGHPSQLFAYPNGDHDERCEPLLAEAGHDAAFLFDHKICQTPTTNRFRVSRVRVNADDSLERFRAIVSGAHPLVHHALGRP